jgi:von Willebrand factor type A domain
MTSLFVRLSGTFAWALLPLAVVWGEDHDTKLVKVLCGRSEEIRLRTIMQLEANPQAKREALDDLVVAADRNVSESVRTELVRPSTVRLIYLIASTESPDAESLLTELLDAEHGGIAMVTADSLGLHKYYSSIEFLKRQIDRPEYKTEYGFRFNLVRSLARMQHPDAVEFLTELVDNLDGQLRYEIGKLLDEVTVKHFLGDEERFAAWQVARKKSEQPLLAEPTAEADAKPSKVVFKTASTPESLQRIQLAAPRQYYGIDIQAKRLMFIIDNSGSMKEVFNGYTRLQLAKNELVRAIEELPFDSEFAILCYHSTMNEWRNELQAATEANKLDAIQFVKRLGLGDKTNTYGALRRSLEFDPSLEAVFLLTDGRPTVGNIVAPNGIIADILHRNRFRHLNFNTIGIAVEGPTEAFLRTLAEQSNGEFRIPN